MKVYIKQHKSHAGKWIYEGYANAWRSNGYDVSYYDKLEEIKNEKDFYLMTLDSSLKKENLFVLNNAKKVFLYVQPLWFEKPWGYHPNFVSLMPREILQDLNQMQNLVKWNFGKKSKYFDGWGDVKSIPLAFDSITYGVPIIDNLKKYDVCYIGGRANNGFDEKYKIMTEIFKEFAQSDLNCGFFIDKSLTNEQERDILFNSKVCINIHDAYQRSLGLDTNERTFKTLGVNGILISDRIEHIKDLGLNVFYADAPKQYVEITKELVSLGAEKLKKIKDENIDNIMKNHTYEARIESMIGEI